MSLRPGLPLTTGLGSRPRLFLPLELAELTLDGQGCLLRLRRTQVNVDLFLCLSWALWLVCEVRTRRKDGQLNRREHRVVQHGNGPILPIPIIHSPSTLIPCTSTVSISFSALLIQVPIQILTRCESVCLHHPLTLRQCIPDSRPLERKSPPSDLL